jgi:hypothetical protein
VEFFDLCRVGYDFDQLAVLGSLPPACRRQVGGILEGKQPVDHEQLLTRIRE